MKNKKLWFKAKTYGWGWYPCTWQGWIIVMSFIAIVTLASLKIAEQPILFGVSLSICTLVLLLICWKKGEKPEWRWGNKK